MATTQYRKWAMVVLLVVWCQKCDLVTGLALDPVGDPCSAVWPGSQYHDNYCYKVIEDKIQWHQLENHCILTKCSAQPAQPMTSEALRFVTKLTLMKSADKDEGSPNVWLGANRNISSHPMRWTCTNQEVNMADQSLWSSVIPDVEAEDVEDEDKNCLALHGLKRETQIRNCLEDGYAVCQMRFGKPCEHAYASDAISDSDLCLRYHREKASLDEAQAICESEGATLTNFITFIQFQLLRRIDSEMNGEESIYVLPPATDSTVGSAVNTSAEDVQESTEATTVNIPQKDKTASFVISACASFVVALTSEEEMPDDAMNTIQFRFQSGGNSETVIGGRRCIGMTETCGDLKTVATLPVEIECISWWHFNLSWGGNGLIFDVNGTDLRMDSPDFQVVFTHPKTQLRLRSIGGPGLVRAKAPSSTEPPSTWLGTYRDTDEDELRWTSNRGVVDIDRWVYNLRLNKENGLLYMDGMGRQLKADGDPSSQKSFICQKRILENTHFVILQPEDENKTALITTEVNVAIVVSVVDFMGLMSMRVSSWWLIKGHPIVMNLSETAQVFDSIDNSIEDYTRTLTVFSTHPSIAVTLLSSDQDNTSIPVLPLELLSNIYLVTRLAKYGKIEIMAIMEGMTMVRFNASDYTNMWVFLEDNIIKDPKSGDIPMQQMEKVMMELHSDRIWLRVEASQPISLLAFENGELVSILPATETTSQYTSVPTYPLSSSSDDTFTIYPLEDDLVMEENGQNSFATLTADDMNVVTVESGTYHTIKSENNVYVTKLDEDNEPVATCSVANQEYDQVRAAHEIMAFSDTMDVITLVAVVGDHMVTTLLLNDEPGMMTCTNISDSPLIGCTTVIEPGFYTLTSTTSEAFKVYVTDSNLDGIFCQYMGITPNTNTRKRRAVSDATDKPYRTQVFITAPPEPTYAITESSPEEEDCERLGTCPKPINKFLNVSVGELVKTIRKDLAVDEKETSAYKRKKISVPDHRFSSQAIGTAGVFFVAFTISFVVFLDCMKLARVMSNVDVVHELKKDVKG